MWIIRSLVLSCSECDYVRCRPLVQWLETEEVERKEKKTPTPGWRKHNNNTHRWSTMTWIIIFYRLTNTSIELISIFVPVPIPLASQSRWHVVVCHHFWTIYSNHTLYIQLNHLTAHNDDTRTIYHQQSFFLLLPLVPLHSKIHVYQDSFASSTTRHSFFFFFLYFICPFWYFVCLLSSSNKK